jgi:hypothetical protein
VICDIVLCERRNSEYPTLDPETRNWLKVCLSAVCSKYERSESIDGAKRPHGRFAMAAAHECSQLSFENFDSTSDYPSQSQYRIVSYYSIRVLQLLARLCPCYHDE